MSKVEFIQRNLIEKIQEYIKISSTIYILTSFVMKSDVRLLKETLKKAAERGADIKICAGDYLFVTHPEALRELISIHPDIEVRLWRAGEYLFIQKHIYLKTQRAAILLLVLPTCRNRR